MAERCILRIVPTCIFNKHRPIVLGVEVIEGIASVGMQFCVPSKDGIDIGRIALLEINTRLEQVAHAGQNAVIRLDAADPDTAAEYGRDFDCSDALASLRT